MLYDEEIRFPPLEAIISKKPADFAPNQPVFGPSGEIRTPGVLIPNNWWNFFLTFSTPFWHLLFRKSCSFELSSPLSPCAPNPVMVKYVVKNRFPRLPATIRKFREAVRSFRGSVQSNIAREIASFAVHMW